VQRAEPHRLGRAPWGARKIPFKQMKHAFWLLLAWWTGGAGCFCFAEARPLVLELAPFEAPAVAYAATGPVTATTYTLAGHLREQVCTYMCPWPRIQGALTDEHSLAITYRYNRGEPRGSAKKNAALRAKGQPAGDCVDCFQCVTACPAGIDIRNGLQMECIQCGLCADACDSVMLKLGRPTGLIAYDTDANIRRRLRGEAPVSKVLRARTVLYGLLIAGVGLAMLTALALRSFTDLSAIHDRNPIHVTLADGSIRNGYTLRLLNKRPIERFFTLTVEGLDGARVEAAGATGDGSQAAIRIGPDTTHEVRALVFAPAGARLEKSTPITFRIVDLASGEAAAAEDYFKAP